MPIDTTLEKRRDTDATAAIVLAVFLLVFPVMGDVAVLGYLTYLEVWELDVFKARLLADPYTEEDEAAIAKLGI